MGAFTDEFIWLCGLDKSVWKEVEITEVSLINGKLTISGDCIHPELEKIIKAKSPSLASNQIEEFNLLGKVEKLKEEITAYLDGKRRTRQLSLLAG